MSTDGSSDWIVPTLVAGVVSIVVLLAVALGAYRLHKHRVSCEERGGVLVIANDQRLCVNKKAVIED